MVRPTARRFSKPSWKPCRDGARCDRGLCVNKPSHAEPAISPRIVAEHGTGILLVEHDMTLVMRICEELFVLDFGQLIFTGTPAAVQASDAVRAAYLGAEGAVGVHG